MSITSNTGGAQCNPGQPLIVVSKGVASRMWGLTRIHAPIGPDGTFQGQSGTAFLSGTVKDGTMQAALGNEYCKFSFLLTKS